MAWRCASTASRPSAKSWQQRLVQTAAVVYPADTSHTGVIASDLTAPSGVVVSSFGNSQSVSVTWDTTSIQNADQIKVVLYNSGVTALAKPLVTINPANDAGSHTFSEVPDGTYYAAVASFRTGERHKLSTLQLVTVE